MKRRRLTLGDRVAILLLQAICPRCKKPIAEEDGTIPRFEWDHLHQLGLDGPDDVKNIRATHYDCHKVKTHGTKAASAGSDAHSRAKARRIGKDYAAAQARLLAPAPPVESAPRYNPKRWPKRPMGKRL